MTQKKTAPSSLPKALRGDAILPLVLYNGNTVFKTLLADDYSEQKVQQLLKHIVNGFNLSKVVTLETIVDSLHSFEPTLSNLDMIDNSLANVFSESLLMINTILLDYDFSYFICSVKEKDIIFTSCCKRKS